MIAKLEFNLPEEQQEFALALNGAKWFIALSTLDQRLRNIVKHGIDRSITTPEEAIDHVRTQLHDILDDYNLLLD